MAVGKLVGKARGVITPLAALIKIHKLIISGMDVR